MNLDKIYISHVLFIVHVTYDIQEYDFFFNGFYDSSLSLAQMNSISIISTWNICSKISTKLIALS